MVAKLPWDGCHRFGLVVDDDVYILWYSNKQFVEVELAMLLLPTEWWYLVANLRWVDARWWWPERRPVPNFPNLSIVAIASDARVVVHTCDPIEHSNRHSIVPRPNTRCIDVCIHDNIVHAGFEIMPKLKRET
jgi:hypothetical protein